MGDGAPGIGEEGAAQLQVTGKTGGEILDFYHASPHIGEVATAVWPQDDATPHAWVDAVLPRRRHEGGEILDEVWKAVPPLSAAAQEQGVRAQAYFAYHHHRLQYPPYRAHGFPSGSGLIESAGQTMLKQRESGSGMRWTESGAQAIATLRAIHRSGRWQDFWHDDPWSQWVPLSQRIAA
jgi:hypothetical protein